MILAENGSIALSEYRERADEIACVLLDLTMPGLDGEQTFAELRRVRPEVRVVLSSGYGEQVATERFEGMGLAGFVQKPYTPSELSAKILEAIQT